MSNTGTILLSNDDGVAAAGLAALAAAFNERFPGRVAVVAPASERSAVGCGVTLRQPLRVERTQLPGLPSVPAFAVSGTPVDCVKLAVHELMPGPVALICSGVNHGANLGTDVFYSGTVSAAIEAAILGLPGIAVSVGPPGQAGYAVAAEIAADLAAMTLRSGLPERTLLNVNVPQVDHRDQLEPLQITRLGRRTYDNRYQQDPADRTGQMYTLAGETLNDDDQLGTDLAAVRRGHVSITPVHLDLTNHAVLAAMEEWLR